MEEKYKYDNRKKVLTRTIKDEQPIRMQDKEAGHFVMDQTQTYSEEGVKCLFTELKMQRQQLQNVLSKANETIENTEHLQEDKELEELREQLQKLKQIEGRMKAKEQRDYALEQLQTVNRQYNDIKQAVGNHIKE